MFGDVLQVFREARRLSPSIVYLPRVDTWWDVTSDTFKSALLSAAISLPSHTPVLLLATSECLPGLTLKNSIFLSPTLLNVVFVSSPENLPLSLQQVFPPVVGVCYQTLLPSAEDRNSFFSDVLLHKALQPPPHRPRPTNGKQIL